MNIDQKYERWLREAVDDSDLLAELREIVGKEEEINDRFYRELDFGTAGLRGIIGAGDNRMNVYTVRKATQGLADYLNEKYDESAVVISYDSRIKSDLFAREAACVLAANGIKTYLFSELQPTPVLSFAVRKLRCRSGIMITASHNPARYNGYKCYNAAGYQMTDEEASAVTECIRKKDIFRDVKRADYREATDKGLIAPIGDEVTDSFLEEVAKQQISPGVCRNTPLKVVYTPLNGTGNKPVRKILKEIGVSRVAVVPEQEYPDGTFATAPYPNPELREAFEKALETAQTERPDLILATDPDCDRVGIAVPDGENGYTLFTGNETGCLLLEYILSRRAERGEIPDGAFTVKTVVTTPLAAKISEAYGCRSKDVLPGFKYIGEQIENVCTAGRPERFIFGFEESYGYLAGAYARDKDAVVASMLICEMTAYYRTKGKTLIDVRRELYERYGFYRNTVLNRMFEGERGTIAMNKLMDRLRSQRPTKIADRRVTVFSDYETSLQTDFPSGETTAIALPRSNVLSFTLEDGAKVIIRPSGTEPKVKIYLTASGKTETQANAATEQLKKAALALTEQVD